MLLIELVRPTVRQLQDVYFQFLPDRIEYDCACVYLASDFYVTLRNARHIRADSLAALTLHANIQPGSRVLVFETCNGLVTAAALNQLGGGIHVTATTLADDILDCSAIRGDSVDNVDSADTGGSIDSGRLVYLHSGNMMPQLLNGCDFPPAVMARLLPISMNHLPDILDARIAFAEVSRCLGFCHCCQTLASLWGHPPSTPTST